MRCIVLCIDGLGIGKLPDAGDLQSFTGISQTLPVNSLVNFKKLGLDYLVDAKTNSDIEASFGRVAIKSFSVSLRTSLWELTGIVSFRGLNNLEDVQEEDFKDISKALNLQIKVAEKMEDKPSSNSILLHIIEGNSILIHSKEDIPENKLSELINSLSKKFKIDEILLTIERKEEDLLIYSRKAERPNLFSEMVKFGYSVQTIGNLKKYFEKNDVNKTFSGKNDEEVFEKLIDLMEDKFDGIIFALFEDYYYKANKRNFVLKRFDGYLPIISDSMKDDDILFITSTTGVGELVFKRTREFIPLMIKGKFIKENTYIGVRHSAADIAQTIADIFGIDRLKYGKSFKDSIMEG